MKYYDVKDVMEFTGLSQSKCYELIQELNKKLQKEFPGTIVFRAKVPKWYFDKKTMMDDERSKKNEDTEV